MTTETIRRSKYSFLVFSENKYYLCRQIIFNKLTNNHVNLDYL